MPLVILGLIVIIAAGLLVYTSTTGKTKSQPSDRPKNREHNYEKSEDGKVVFLYNHSAGAGKKADSESDAEKTEDNSDEDQDS
ncbi:MAG: hypothetical protein LBN36_01050 [Clostridiales Family XIII bacterium]|jgi:hypothetical protein|nr:hypothetical protein [Clostridiales Family XIII bacterium]